MDGADEAHLEVEALVGAPAHVLLRRRELLHQLHDLVRRGAGDEFAEAGSKLLGQADGGLLRRDLADEQLAHGPHDLGEQLAHVAAGFGELVHEVQEARQLAVEDEDEGLGDGLAAGDAEDVIDVLLDDVVAAEGDELVEHGLRVAHAAVGHAGNGLGRGGRQRNALARGDIDEVVRDDVGRDGA